MKTALLILLVIGSSHLTWATGFQQATASAATNRADSAGVTSDDEPSTGSAPPAASNERGSEPVVRKPRSLEVPDFNRNIYYKNKREFSFEGGWLPYNIPFAFGRMIGMYEATTPLHYTLVPFFASLRWHMNGIGGRWIFRGNWDATFTSTYTMIPRGPETRYFAYVMGIRRNFIQPNWKIAPYFEGRAGMGDVNAKEPYGAQYAQGQDFTFTVMLGGGARYNFNPRFSLSAGVLYMHISNLYLSEPQFPNYGINVYGPTIGINIGLNGDKRRAARADARTVP